MKKVIATISLLFVFQLLSSQIRSYSPEQPKDDSDVNMVSHSVEVGETVKLISQKYLVTPAAIYKVNKFAVDGVKPGMVLQIPVPNKTRNNKNNKSNKSVESIHDESAPVAVEHNGSVDEEGVIPSNNQAMASSEPGGNTYSVQSGDTLSGLAKKFGVSQQDLKDWNPKVGKRGLRAGEMIKIKEE